MEEQVGQLWHGLITRAAATHFPQAAVNLPEVQRAVGVLFRALGGESGMRIEVSNPTSYPQKRNFLQRVAGSHQKVNLAWRDAESLRLPAQLAVFPEQALNRDLYLWLAVLAAKTAPQIQSSQQAWFVENQKITQQVLAEFAGLTARYQRLVTAQLVLRPELKALSVAQRAQELAIQQALREPNSVPILPTAEFAPAAVYLWLHPFPPTVATASAIEEEEEEGEGATAKKTKDAKNKTRREAERVKSPDGTKGLLAFRLESLFTRAEYTKVDRTTDDDEDLDKAEDALEDMDKVSVIRDKRSVASALRFDFDLPQPEYDDQPIGEGILQPEWDYQRRQLIADHCRVQVVEAPHQALAEIPVYLQKTARRLRRQFATLQPTRVWHKQQQEGSEIDLSAYLEHVTDRTQGKAAGNVGLYQDFRGGQRDLACLLLADVSMSTDAWINNQARVIDVIQDSLFLFGEALSASRDQFAMYGFCSRRRDPVRLHQIKPFNQAYNAEVRGRIKALRPSYYTRMGAAVRYATEILHKQPARQHLLLLLTDGKPNDMDQYEGRYGIEDTRHALRSAQRQGIQAFCVTIDEKAGQYLPHLFGSTGYVVIRNPVELPKELPLLYLRLT
jgi:nitric oxide reductase NorD protein